MAVHAHPDDESITTGGLLLRCAAEGIETTLVTCTDGRLGPVSPEFGSSLTREELARVRADELRDAALVLGVGNLVQLLYQDSGMTGDEQNRAPDAFWSRHIDELVRTLVAEIRQARPHVVVTYDPFGNTGHPDHVQAHRVTVLAIQAAAEGSFAPDLGPAWVVNCLLHPVFPVSEFERWIDSEISAGRPHPFDGKPTSEVNYLRSDVSVTHVVEITDVYADKERALGSHRTQVGSHYPQMYLAALARRDQEHFRVAAPGMAVPVDFADVFRPAG